MPKDKTEYSFFVVVVVHIFDFLFKNNYENTNLFYLILSVFLN